MAHRVASRLNWAALSPLFWVLAALYAGHRIWTWLNFSRPDWVRFYADDLLCLPLILTTTLFILKIFHGPMHRLTSYQVGIAVVYYALAFEVFFPMFLPRYTADIVDVVLYAAGGWFFYRFLNK
jgi:hypothetical protein